MKNLSQIIEELREVFVAKDIFELRMSPIEKLVYGLVGVVLLSVAGILGTAITFFVRMKP